MLCEQNLRADWSRIETVRAEIGPILQTHIGPTHASKLVVEIAYYCFEKRRRIRREESDGDGGAGEKKERKAKAEVVG